ncbi:hypothetical protein D5086_027042 [Populus alba]|uniref:Uncharacterized protein n=1 Tax=Populus alba TaxID=43335 RepID=A0ACC4B5B0_POPAL
MNRIWLLLKGLVKSGIGSCSIYPWLVLHGDACSCRMMCLDVTGIAADWYFMEKISSGKEVHEEKVAARESLMDISDLLPENSNSTERPIEVKDYSDGTEKYRSELISISNSQSPDIKGLPVPLGEPSD